MVARRILIAALLCAATAAQASPRTDVTSGRAVFTGASTPHATSITLNPSALGLSDFNEVYVALTGTLDQLHLDLAPFTGAAGTAAATKIRAIEASPGGMIAFIYHAGDRGTLGFEAHTNPRESFIEGRQALRYHTLGGGERDWTASVGASLRATDELYFGASLSHQNTYLRLRYARDTALEAGTGARGIGGDCGDGDPCTLGDPRASETYDVNVSSTVAESGRILRYLSTSNLRVSIGAMYQIMRNVWLGVGYHTPPGFSVQTELVGHVDIARAPRDIVGEGAATALRGQSVVEIQLPASADAELRARLPANLDLHIGGRWEDLSRLSSYDVRTYGTTLRSNGIPEWMERARGMRDAFAVWGGVEQIDLGQAQKYRGGVRLGFETSSVTTNKLSPLTIAPTSVTLDLGMQVRFTRLLSVQLSYGLQYFPGVTSHDSLFDPDARLACIASGYDYDTAACAAVRNGYAIAPGDGTYERFQHAMRIGLRYEIH